VSHQGLRIGKILHLTEGGAAVVDWNGNPAGPLTARSALGVQRVGDEECSVVVLGFEEDDPAKPVILGFVHDTLFAEEDSAACRRTAEAPRVIVLEARDSLELRCGESSITLDRAGRVRVKGTQVVSRSSGLQRIKGATVEIN
jgi:Domain of unknown function (DUF6484)